MGIVVFNSKGGAEGSQTYGRALTLKLPGNTSGQILQMENWGGFQTRKAIFTRLGISEGTNHQFMHTLGDRVYLYVFGDRLGTMNLQGFAFLDTCDSQSKEIGLTQVLRYYRENRLSTRRNPLKITIDPGTVFLAYLSNFDAEMSDPASQIYQFNMKLQTISDI